MREDNLAQAYMLLLRYSTLVIDYIPKHPEAKLPENKKAIKGLRANLGRVLGTLDQIKPHLNYAHEEWTKIHAATQHDPSIQLQGEKSPYEKAAARDPALSWNAKARATVLDAGQYQDLAVDLATQEIRRRDAARKATRQAGISEEEEQVRRGAGLWDTWDAPASARPSQTNNNRHHDDPDDIRRNMDAVRRRLDQSETRGRPPSPDGQTRPASSFYDRPPSYQSERPPSYQYPSISRSTPQRQQQQYDNVWIGDTRDRRQLLPPARPPKPRGESESVYGNMAPPPRPSKNPLDSEYATPSPSSLSPVAPQRPPKMDSENEKKERYTFRPAAYLEDGSPIRPIFLPANLREEFLRVASPNTRKNLEMCGILCGTAVNNALFISCLVIPQQTCTDSTCDTDNEMDVLEYCTEQELQCFGWIHTHPSQSCFLSSRDLHTQSGYQAMMPESIAIVCAPSDPNP